MHPSLHDIISGIDSDDPEAFLGANELLRARKIGPRNDVIEPYASMYIAQPLDADARQYLQKFNVIIPW